MEGCSALSSIPSPDSFYLEAGSHSASEWLRLVVSLGPSCLSLPESRETGGGPAPAASVVASPVPAVPLAGAREPWVAVPSPVAAVAPGTELSFWEPRAQEATPPGLHSMCCYSHSAMLPGAWPCPLVAHNSVESCIVWPSEPGFFHRAVHSSSVHTVVGIRALFPFHG